MQLAGMNLLYVTDPPAVETRLSQLWDKLWYYTYILIAECKLEAEKKEMKKKAEEYLARAEQLKKRVKDLEGIWL